MKVCWDCIGTKDRTEIWIEIIARFRSITKTDRSIERIEQISHLSSSRSATQRFISLPPSIPGMT